MDWLPSRVMKANQQRLQAVLVENILVTEEAKLSAQAIETSVEAEHLSLVQAMQATEVRRLQREKRARERAKKDPALSAVNDVLKLLEGRH